MTVGKSPLRLLIVEDDPVHRMIAERYLARIADDVEVVDSAADLAGARAALATASPPVDLVLLDLTLPDSPLDDTLRLLATLVDEWSARIVATSSLDAPDVIDAVTRSGAAGFLSKDKMSTESLREALGAPGGSRATDFGAPPAAEPANHNGHAPSPAATSAPPAHDEETRALHRSVASRLNHDANSWITSGAFRVAAIRGLVDRTTLAVIGSHLDAIEESLHALAATGRAARSTFLDESTELDVETGDAIALLADEVEDWRQGTKATRVQVTLEGSTGPVRLAPQALGWIVASLLDNADAHGTSASAGDPIHVVLRGDGDCSVEVTDDGGPWRVDAPERLGEAGAVGTRGTPHPGMGLFRARRLMERVGGTLEVGPRDEVPGAYRVLLTF
ncbi:MAG: response regulator, partial [Planctomycetota bacterium]